MNQPIQPFPRFYCRDATKIIPIEAKEQINHLRDLLSSKRWSCLVYLLSHLFFYNLCDI